MELPPWLVSEYEYVRTLPGFTAVPLAGETDFVATTHVGEPNWMSSRKFPTVGFPLPVGPETKANRVSVWPAGTT